MKIINSRVKVILLLLILSSLNTYGYSETMILSECKNLKDGFVKNEYILDLEKSLMIRNYIYDSKTYKKYRITDLSTKKKIPSKDSFMKKRI